MAVWHFKFSILPAKGVMSKHASMPSKLEGYEANFHQDISIFETEDVNYWEGFSMTVLHHFCDANFVEIEAWPGEDAVFYSGEGIILEIWPDGVFIDIDVSGYNIEGIKEILHLCYDNELLLTITENGRLIEAELNLFLEHYYKSRAYRFIYSNKNEVLEEIKLLNGDT